MLRFILGRSGAGKTTYIYDTLTSLALSGESGLYLLVPDQSTFEAEKSLLSRLGADRFDLVTTLGFDRLCRHVFELTSTRTDNVIDPGTKSVLMSLALEELTEKLTLLNVKNNRSMTELMLHTLTESKKSGITSVRLRAVSESIRDNTLKTKLFETSLIFDAYEASLSQSYIDPLDDLDRVYELLLSNPDLFEGKKLYIDSFSGFTAQQQRVLTLLLERCSEVVISLTMDPDISAESYSGDVFATTSRTYFSLKNICYDIGVEVGEPVVLSDSPRYSNAPSLSNIEQRIFRVRGGQIPLAYTPDNVTLYEATDPHNECEFIAQSIKSLIIDSGYLYSDIAVICHGTDEYRGIIDAVFDKYEIPYFLDTQQDVEIMPVIRFVNAVFRLLLDNFEREDVLFLLKSGLTLNSPDDISIFENYILKWNINNSGFKSEFVLNPRGFSRELDSSDEADLATAERVRRSFVEPLLSFRENSRDCDVRQLSSNLYGLMLEMRVPDALRKMNRELEAASDRETIEEQIKVWKLLMDALDKLVAVAGDKKLSLKRYHELLGFQIASMELSRIPQTVDSVTITTAQRVRSKGVRAAFLIGCAEGVFPAAPEISGLFSPYELSLLSENNLRLTDGTAEIAELERFMAYTCVTLASERLCVSYHASDLSDNRFKPSEIITELRKRVFPLLNMLTAADFAGDYTGKMYALRPAFEAYAASLGSDCSELINLREFFESDDDYSSKCSALYRALDNAPFEISDKSIAERLFGNELNVSASQLKTFSQCPFSYFCQYGLRVKERKEAKIDPIEIGNLVHEVLEKFFTAFSKPQYSTMNDDEIKAFVNDCVASYLETYFGGSLTKDEEFLFELEMIKNNVLVIIRHVSEELSQSSFDVIKCEMAIPGDISKHTLTLSDGHSISIIGKVDRADVMTKNGTQYLRVVDYKTGPMDFRIGDIIHGINMQMLIYLHTILCEGESVYGKMKSAGILYAPAEIEAVTDYKSESGEVKAKIRKALRMNGLILDDEDIILGMDSTDNRTYIPVAVKPNRDQNSRITDEEFDKVFAHIDRTVEQMGERLYNGRIEAMPLKGFTDGCEYCKFDSVCAFRRGSGKLALSLGKDETIAQIDDELEKEAEERKGGEGDAVD